MLKQVGKEPVHHRTQRRFMDTLQAGLLLKERSVKRYTRKENSNMANTDIIDTTLAFPQDEAEQPIAAHGKKRWLAWHHMALVGITLISVFMNYYLLGTNGYGSYYPAAVRSMMDSWHNFFFAAYDPGGFVSIDKPPVGFWLEVASAKLFGFNSVSILLPQALAGVLSVLLLYYLVRRHFGVVAGLLAALALAVSPISVVTNRNDTIDSTLVLVLLIGAWAVLHAADTGRLRWLLLTAVIVGVGFNIKMLEAYLVVPAYGLLYLLAAPRSIWKRLLHLALAGLLLLVISLSWVVAVDLTPASQRPYVGSTQNNSEITLAFGYNGIQRLLGQSFTNTSTGGSRPSGNPSRNGTPPPGVPSSGRFGGGRGPSGGGGGVGGGIFNTGSAGPLRLFIQPLAEQIAWLLPLAILGAVALAWQRRPRLQSDRKKQSLVLWGTWLLTMGVFFSVASFFHQYYMTMMAPAIAALFGIGLVTMWQDYRSGGWRGWLLPIAIVVTIAEQIYLLTSYPTWGRVLIPLLIILCVVAVGILLIARIAPHLTIRAIKIRFLSLALGIGVLAMLLTPTVWAAIPVFASTQADTLVAGPSSISSSTPGGGAFGGDTTSVNSKLIRYLEIHQGKAKFLVAVLSSGEADSIILATNKPVMALGGFGGSDPILTTSQLSTLVKNGTIRFFLINGSSGGGFGGGSQSALTTWIKQHCKVVTSSQWQSSSTGSNSDRFGGSQQLYEYTGT
jgi:4-amino-4-deoxy-L-arabinose transferase-like glycosyltransferase